MDNLDIDNLINIIDTSIKASFEAIICPNNKPYPNVANYGAKKGTIAKLQRHGEYYGIGVEILSNIKPLLTNYLVKKILILLKKEDYMTPLKILELETLDELFHILDTWFQFSTTDYDNSIKCYKSTNIEKFNKWIKTVRSDPLPSKIKIIEIGQNENTGESVLPVEWIDMEFESGEDMHLHMDKLESRLAKPPVTYACIYSMTIQQKDDILTDISGKKFSYIWYLNLDKDKLTTILTKKINTSKLYTYVQYGNVMVGFILSDILEKKDSSDTNTKNKEVGTLVSKLQKSIRRGGYGRSVLEETIESLNCSPNYNLPEHAFLRVSASKQLVWRLFITILEDCRPYEISGEELGLLELILLVLITQRCLEYKFKPKILKLIKLTAVLAQFNDMESDLFDWRSEKESKEISVTKSDFHNSIYLALEHVIMMKGDSLMLRKYFSAKNNFEKFVTPTFYYIDEKICSDITLSSIDHHSKTYIILYYQACIPISITTKEISRYIWDISSSYNIRSTKKEPKIDPVLRSIQSYLSTKPPPRPKIPTYPNGQILQKKPSNHIARTSFIILFGKKYKHGSTDVIICGSPDFPAKIKLKNEWINSNDIDILNSYGTKTIDLSKIDPPMGFKWSRSIVNTCIKNGIPYIDKTMVDFFDGSCILESNVPDICDTVKKSTRKLIVQILSGLDIDLDTILYLRNNFSSKIKNWDLNTEELKIINKDLLRGVYVKIFNQLNSLIIIGPTDRSGDKMANSISYLFEGKIWAVFNLFCYLYPITFRPHGVLNFIINKNTVGYTHIINTLQSILFVQKKPKSLLGPDVSIIPTIKTKLWTHQEESVQKIIHGFKNGIHGLGDSSDVGSGKTLVALSVSAELSKNSKSIYTGILVLLPGNALIKTWKDELKKHTRGFDVRFQSNNANIKNINSNTIVISTMGKMRDHPINHNWSLTIIDECLTTQNRNALWTQEAWKQGLMSDHLLMLSATFFRAKFLGLYYMLQMLQTGLPEQKEYLDTILLESIVSKVPKNKRKWTINLNYFTLNESDRKSYSKIESKDLTVETKYAKLNSFLTTNESVQLSTCVQLKKLIKKLEKDNKRCLIYARSKTEAELWSEQLEIGIYPEKQKHTIITVTNGTYGLNDLVQYNCICMMPPPPDKIPQMKGRLDRPGQLCDKLSLEYFITKDTIDEGLMLRVNICNSFMHQHIMPLSKFFEIAVNHKAYLHKKIEK